MSENILAGYLANAFFTISLILIGWFVYLATERRKLLNFYKIANSKRLVIYLSNLRIVRGGSVGIDNLPRGYSGTAVVHNEQLFASKFKERFNYLIPSLSESASILSKIVFADISIAILPSPLSENEIEANTSILSFGSPGYNKASQIIESNPNSHVRFSNDNSSIEIREIPIDNNITHGFIQRLVINTIDLNRNQFYVAGLTERGTIGAANYLLKNWRGLSRRYKNDESFLILLSFPTDNIDNFAVVMERRL